jgi:hypothetical protein
MSDSDAPNADGAEPTTEQVVAILFQAAMHGNEAVWAQANNLDPKLLQIWKFTHAQEYITYLEKVLRMIKSRAGTGE